MKHFTILVASFFLVGCAIHTDEPHSSEAVKGTNQSDNPNSRGTVDKDPLHKNGAFDKGVQIEVPLSVSNHAPFTNFNLFEYYLTSAAGFCVSEGLYRAVLERSEAGTMFRGSILRKPAGPNPVCVVSEYGRTSRPCLEEVPLSPRLLSPEEEARMHTAFSQVFLVDAEQRCDMDPCSNGVFLWDGQSPGQSCAEPWLNAHALYYFLAELSSKANH